MISSSAGTNGTSNTRMRTIGYVDDTVTFISVTDGNLIIHAYSSGTYMGHYNGSGFDKTTTVVSYTHINLSAMRTAYPGYEYRLVWYKSSSYDVTPSSDYAKIIYTAYIVKAINDIQEKIEEIETKQNEFIGNYSTVDIWESGLIGTTNGNNGTSQSRIRTSVYIPKDASYIIAKRGMCMVYAYDSSENYSFVGAWRGTEFTTDSDTSNITHTDVDLSIVKVAHPEYVYRVVWYLSSNYTPVISVDYANIQILNQSSLVALSSSLKKSTIVNMGDSIFGRYNAPTDISTYLSYGTGATVYNCAFGGTRAVTRTSNTTYFKYFDLTTLVDAIISGDYSEQDAAALTSESDIYLEHLSVLKTVDFNNVDLLTLSYGTNDYAGDIQIGTVDNDDATTFIGAFQEVINKLHTAFPKMRIALCTPIFRMYHVDDNYINADIRENTNSDTLTDFVNAIKTVGIAEYVEVIDNHYIGINPTNWQSYLGDGTHPSEDGRKLIARNMLHSIY